MVASPRCDSPASAAASGGKRVISGDCDDSDRKVADFKVSASQSGQTLRQAVDTKGSAVQPSEHAINTKGTGTSGRVGAPVVVTPPPIDKDCDG